jgi:hypothetical protein
MARPHPSLRLAARRPRRPLRAVLAAVALIPALAAAAAAQPVVGFTEDFPTTTGSWGGGAVFTNPGSGGLGGASDGYLRVETFSPANLGTVGRGAEYVGDWLAAGIGEIRLHLVDAGGTGDLSIHVGLGNGLNFWQLDTGFVPAIGTWTEFVVDLEDSTLWTRTIGGGSFAGALQNVDRVLVRHDLPPFVQTPDPIQGAFGLDHVVLGAGTVGAPAAPAVAAVRLAPPAPNPARGPVRFAIEAPAAEAVTLDLLDVAGRRIARTRLGGGSTHRSWRWDGRDAAGLATPAGIYRVRIEGPSGSATRTFVRIGP